MDHNSRIYIVAHSSYEHPTLFFKQSQSSSPHDAIPIESFVDYLMSYIPNYGEIPLFKGRVRFSLMACYSGSGTAVGEVIFCGLSAAAYFHYFCWKKYQLDCEVVGRRGPAHMDCTFDVKDATEVSDIDLSKATSSHQMTDYRAISIQMKSTRRVSSKSVMPPSKSDSWLDGDMRFNDLEQLYRGGTKIVITSFGKEAVMYEEDTDAGPYALIKTSIIPVLRYYALLDKQPSQPLQDSIKKLKDLCKKLKSIYIRHNIKIKDISIRNVLSACTEITKDYKINLIKLHAAKEYNIDSTYTKNIVQILRELDKLPIPEALHKDILNWLEQLSAF